CLLSWHRDTLLVSGRPAVPGQAALGALAPAAGPALRRPVEYDLVGPADILGPGVIRLLRRGAPAGWNLSAGRSVDGWGRDVGTGVGHLPSASLGNLHRSPVR